MAYTTIDDPSAHFQVATYSGTGSNQTITNDGNSDLQPDLVWVKCRADDGGAGHRITDSSRLASGLPTLTLQASSTAAEYDDNVASGSAATTSFNTDGFSIGTNGNYNTDDDTYVAWQWKANGGTKTTFTESGNNPGGSYQVNTTAGFSILDYTGTGAAGTVAHGLGAVPEVMIVKDRSSDGDDWFVYHVITGNDGGTRLNTTAADGDDSNRWNDTTPTSSVCTFGASGGTNDDGKATIAYVFAPIQGYSKFGSYKGNGAEPEGPFIYTGFKPAYILIHASSESGQGWVIGDNKRSPSNPCLAKLFANTTSVEGAASGDNNWDFLSNGFRIVTQDDAMNKSGVTYIYMAFAEHPFVSSEGVPTTAR